jgi:NAD(P)-dependent dehydrogenase (short-subunit alcohol dehydrogenase family)
MGGLADKRILLIGGGSGIGFAVAEAAAAEGAQVTLASTKPDKLAAAAQKLGGAAASAVLDATDEGAVEAFFAANRFDHIVYTAGDWSAVGRGPVAAADLAAATQVFRVRFWGALAVAKHGAKTLPSDGSLTLTDGMIAHRPTKGSAISTAMAGAIEHLTRALAVEFAPVRVNCVCPGLIRTEVWDQLLPPGREAQIAKMTERQLLARPGAPAEAAQAYLYLMKGGYTTGQVLYVDGGSMLGR